MDNRIEYGWVEPDPATGEPAVVKTEWKGQRLRVRAVEVAPAETREYRGGWIAEDGSRSGTIVGKLFVDALVLPAEIKTGADGRPVVRPIETAPRPPVQPWERLVGPLYRIEPERITRYWTVEDRPLEELQTERTAEVKAELSARIADRLLERDDASDLREAGRAALAAIAAAETPRAVSEVAVDWPA
ncbi:hypothetical protein STAQ_27560 [Allostella sp. ATCC 35155]|nr:hypothetical protein STAQ_27560 [Stella sp. ATCC 35155]